MEVEFWKTWSGRSPVYKFLEKQPPDASTRMLKDIEHLEKQGLKLAVNPNKVKALTGYKDLYELRTDFKGVFYRIIFCVNNGKAYLLEAFKKKRNDTKPNHIQTALKRQHSLGNN
jgi:phage-related protein